MGADQQRQPSESQQNVIKGTPRRPYLHEVRCPVLGPVRRAGMGKGGGGCYKGAPSGAVQWGGSEAGGSQSALSTTGTTLLGGVPSASDLSVMRVAEQPSEGGAGAPGLDDCLDKQTGVDKGPAGDKGLLELAAPVKPQFFSVVQGLPTMPSKLAQSIWDLDFVEMDDFLPSNKAVQALEHQSTSQVVQDGVLGALQ